jgi:putative transposase
MPNKLRGFERQKMVSLVNIKSFSSLPLSQIVPALADADEYIRSGRTFYRILKSEGLNHHRGKA